MTYLIDTNIIVHFVRDSALYKAVENDYQIFESPNKVVISG